MEEFDAVITAADRGGAYVSVPAAVVDALGGGSRITVRATFDGVAYRGSVVSMGGAQVLGVLKRIRTELGKGSGDSVHVTLVRDDEERTVEVPDDLRDALTDAGIRSSFDAMSSSHRREYVEWIDEAKRPATRARRIAETVRRVRN